MSSREQPRQNPDALLRHIQEQEALEGRGRLKIFLGYAPRVGKSVRMFEEGRRRKSRGQDVVVGVTQSRGLQDVERLIAGFEVVPPVETDGGVAIDIDAIKARAPEVCLIDELARANPPGSRHAHRWQDVEEICACGINVVGAINLQHIFEQQEAVQQITGKRSGNAVPASFIRSADEIVIVDVPAEGPARFDSLTSDQLTSLREMALLLAAQVVEDQLQRYLDSHGIHQSWGTQERILVCVTSRPSARSMLESGARAASRFHGHLLAVWVKQPDLTRDAEESVQQNLDYARRLGAEIHILEGREVLAEIIRLANEQRVTQLFIGHTRQRGWKFWQPSAMEQLIAAADGIDVRIFPQPHTV